MADLQKLQFNNRTILTSGRDSFVAFNNYDPGEDLNKFYPVGTYYSTMDPNFDPNVSFVGTWVRDTDGLVIRGGTTIGTTGGEQTHELTTSELPQHNHVTNRYVEMSGKTAPKDRGSDHLTSLMGNWVFVPTGSNSVKYSSFTTSSCTNTSASHNNVQKSLICIRWHRTE